MSERKPLKTYWGHAGRHQPDFDRLWAALVPAEGEAPTPHGELLRVAGRLNYDIYNNGGCNLDVLGRFIHTLTSHEDSLLQKMRSKAAYRLAVDELVAHSDSLNDLDPDDPESHEFDDAFYGRWEKVLDAVVRLVREIDKKSLAGRGDGGGTR
jgi:hypothetical protein